jgi:hypothetical protein
MATITDGHLDGWRHVDILGLMQDDIYERVIKRTSKIFPQRLSFSLKVGIDRLKSYLGAPDEAWRRPRVNVEDHRP